MEIPRALEPVPLIILEAATVSFQQSATCIQMLQQRVAFLRRPILRDTDDRQTYSAVLHPGNEAKIRAHALPDRIALGTQVVVVVPVDSCSRTI